MQIGIITDKNGNPTGGGGSWITALDLDFTAYSVNLTGDGTKVIGGYNFTKVNSSGDTGTAMVCTSGSGIVITPDSNTFYGGGTRTSPLLWLRFDQFLPSTVDWDTGIRVYAYIPSFTNGNSNYDQSIIGVDSNSTALQCVCIRGAANGPARVVSAGVTLAASQTGFDSTVTNFDSSNATQMLEIDAIMPNKVRAFYGTGANYPTAFPALSAMNIAGVAQIGPNTVSGYAAYPITGGTLTPSTTLGVVLTAMRGNSGDAVVVTIARLRVDYRL